MKLDPEMLELVPRSSRGGSASVDGAALVAPGRYRGLLLADGADEVAVPVELVVARGIADAALDAFDLAFAAAEPGPDSEFVRALVPYMLGRAS